MNHGVLRVTLYDENRTPMAERLIFRKAPNELKFEIITNKEVYQPGERVSFNVNSFDKNGKPVPSYFNVCVTDDTVLEMVDRREQPPRLPVLVYFSSEVDRLEDSHVYLDEKNPKSNVAVDLMLGTQGWRRFAFINPKNYFENTEHDQEQSRKLFSINENYEEDEIFIDYDLPKKPNKKIVRKGKGQIKKKKIFEGKKGFKKKSFFGK